MKKQWKALAVKRAAKMDKRNKRNNSKPKSFTFGGRKITKNVEA